MAPIFELFRDEKWVQQNKAEADSVIYSDRSKK
jgi:hypothetical protein